MLHSEIGVSTLRMSQTDYNRVILLWIILPVCPQEEATCISNGAAS